MSVVIRQVQSKQELRDFVRFNYKLYKNNPYSVPDLYMDAMSTFNPKENAAYEFCEAACFLAYKDGKLVGRVAAIINNRANEKWNVKNVRFGWIDFVDDEEVSEALLDTVAEWGKERGMNKIVGPLGFTDIDPEGMLVEGFDQLGTMSSIYNYPYYSKHLEKHGYVKETDWVEFKIMIPSKMPEKYTRVADIIQRRYNLHLRKIHTLKELKEGRYGYRLFEIMNEAYASLYGYSQISEKQIDMYVKNYFTFLDLRLVSIVEDENGELVAAGLCMPSLSKALQKAHGRLFPFGWFHLLMTLYIKRPKVLDLLLVGVRPKYQGTGATSLIFYDITKTVMELGYEYAETNPELESNKKIQAQWSGLETIQHKRRRAYGKSIE